MSWKHLKTLAIVILLMMDVIFVFNVAERKRAVAYYDDALIDSAITVLKESGLYVERSFLEEKKQNASVYVGKISADAFTPIMAAMTEQGYTAEEEPGGLSFAGEKGRFFFGNDFLFTYYETGFTEAPSKLFSGRYYVVLTAEDEQTKVARSMVETFLDSYALCAVSKTKYAYDFDFLNFYYSGTDCIVHLSQKVGDFCVGDGIYLRISGGRVVAVDGTFAAIAPTEKANAESVGLMNILFAEKAYLDVPANKLDAYYILAGVSYSYGLYFDANNTFYLIPLCDIAYQNGEIRTYNFISGKLYS